MSPMCYFSSKWRLLKPLPLFLQGYSVSLQASFTLSLHPVLLFLIQNTRSPFLGLKALIVNTFQLPGHWFGVCHSRCFIGYASALFSSPSMWKASL